MVFGPEQMTYGELDQASDAVADQLRRNGAGAGDVIAVVDERCLALPSLLLGVLKAGATYLGVDPGLPEARLRSILGDAGVRMAIKASGSSALLPGVSSPRARAGAGIDSRRGSDAQRPSRSPQDDGHRASRTCRSPLAPPDIRRASR